MVTNLIKTNKNGHCSKFFNVFNYITEINVLITVLRKVQSVI
jgi:hypothetical protein